MKLSLKVHAWHIWGAEIWRLKSSSGCQGPIQPGLPWLWSSGDPQPPASPATSHISSRYGAIQQSSVTSYLQGHCPCGPFGHCGCGAATGPQNQLLHPRGEGCPGGTSPCASPGYDHVLPPAAGCVCRLPRPHCGDIACSFPFAFPFPLRCRGGAPRPHPHGGRGGSSAPDPRGAGGARGR